MRWCTSCGRSPFTGYNAEEVGGFGEEFLPDGVEPFCVIVGGGGGSRVEEVTVAEEDWVVLSISFDADAIKDGHLFRSVGVVGDAAESHCFYQDQYISSDFYSPRLGGID